MKPLREAHDSVDSDVAAAARLLAQVGPLPHSRLTQRRVRHQLENRHDYRVARALRPALVFGVLCGLAATAGATWGVLQATASSEQSTALEAPVVPRGKPAPPKANGWSGPVRAASQERSTAEPTAPAVDPAALTPRPSGRSTAAKPSKSPRVAPTSDAALVHGAVKELRGGGDPERARRLLEQYRATNPSGELAEEALILSIEAAVAEGDPEAKRLARQYLAKYPNGRFVAAARRAMR